jgi:hypothetical protein
VPLANINVGSLPLLTKHPATDASPLPVSHNEPMSITLLNSNPYLRDPVRRAAALRVSAASSSAVEGIRKPFAKGGALMSPAVTRKKPAKSGG